MKGYQLLKVRMIGPAMVELYAPYIDDPSRERKVLMGASAYAMWQGGSHLQDVAPEMDADDREFLISGISPEGWAEMFQEDEDDPS